MIKEKFHPSAYEYVGPKRIFDRIETKYKGTLIKKPEDIKTWISKSHGNIKPNEILICTFVINLRGELLIADRHSEHVQCANGEAVKSAGEIGFLVDHKNKIQVTEVTNQSTGYCPSSASWVEVAHALEEINNLSTPENFTTEFIFSYCPNCKTRQIVKDEYFFCPECEEALLSENDFQKRRSMLEFR